MWCRFKSVKRCPRSGVYFTMSSPKAPETCNLAVNNKYNCLKLHHVGYLIKYILLILTGNRTTTHFIRAIWTLRHSITCLVYGHTRSIHMAHEHTISTVSLGITIIFIFSFCAIIGSITYPWWLYAASWKQNYTATLHVFLYTIIQMNIIRMVKILIWGTMNFGFYCKLKLSWWTLLTLRLPD